MSNRFATNVDALKNHRRGGQGRLFVIPMGIEEVRKFVYL